MHSTSFRVKWAVWEVDILHWSLFYNFFYQRLVYIYMYQHSPKRNDFVEYSSKQLFYLIGFRFYFLFFYIGKPIFFPFVKTCGFLALWHYFLNIRLTFILLQFWLKSWWNIWIDIFFIWKGFYYITLLLSIHFFQMSIGVQLSVIVVSILKLNKILALISWITHPYIFIFYWYMYLYFFLIWNIWKMEFLPFQWLVLLLLLLCLASLFGKEKRKHYVDGANSFFISKCHADYAFNQEKNTQLWK